MDAPAGEVSGRPVSLGDGCYQVTTPSLCAGFLVRGGVVAKTECAPILWARLHYWQYRARFISPLPSPDARDGRPEDTDQL